MDAAPDRQLYELWREGRRDAGGRLLERHIPRVRRFFTYNVTRDEADDLLSKTLEIVAKRASAVDAADQFGAFLYGVARNVLRDHVKAGRRRRSAPESTLSSLVDPTPSPLENRVCREEERLLLEALRSLSLEHQAVLELSYFEELSRSEIAELLQLPPGTVASRLRLGRNQLGQHLLRLQGSEVALESTLSDVRFWARSLRASLLEEA